MTDYVPSPQEEEQAITKDEMKRLRKREQRTLERLQEAQKAQHKALERFRRADERLQKRVSRVQRASGRLELIRQQLGGLATIPPVNAASSAPGDERSVEVEQPVKEARSAAEAAEEHVRLATERAGMIGHSEVPGEEVAASDAPETTPMPGTAQESRVPEEIVDIEEEEEAVAAITAETIAHIAAERAAKAEAMAEISSAQTREARYLVQQAEQALAHIRVAIRNGALSGQEAEAALRHAEHEVTQASALLADAEAAEEQAVNAAMNAEAEAEVAEGMAYAAVDHNALLADAEAHDVQDDAWQAGDDEVDVTTKMPIVRPQEQS